MMGNIPKIGWELPVEYLTGELVLEIKLTKNEADALGKMADNQRRTVEDQAYILIRDAIVPWGVR